MNNDFENKNNTPENRESFEELSEKYTENISDSADQIQAVSDTVITEKKKNPLL